MTTIVGLQLLTSCKTAKDSAIPLTVDLKVEDTYTIIWNGISRAYRYTNDDWVREDSYDYLFNVVQKRYNNNWKSVKTLHRINPAYDGKAGYRDQTMYFEIDYPSYMNNKVRAQLKSSLGDGDGVTDTEFRNTELTLSVKGATSVWPYNRIRIKQQYDYERGILTETVFLYKEKNGVEYPFMKNEEIAYFYIKGTLKGAPTKFVVN